MNLTHEKTGLWQLLTERASTDDHVRTATGLCMRRIEVVLAKGGTALPDFTLHDNEHGFRVAESMRKLLPPDLYASIGTFEIALLLLSAYLHDIGMTPTRDKVQRHYRYIQTADKALLDGKDIEELRRWLDEEHGGLDLPVSVGRPTASELEQADLLLAYYCRLRHNDWSEEWIRGELSDLSPPLYPDWIQDLVTLCRSHHEGLHDLQSARFDAKLAGSPSQVINLR